MSDLKHLAVHKTDLTATKNKKDSNFIGQIAGYAIVFNKPSVDLGFIEHIEPQALRHVDLSNVLALYNHDYANVLGRVDAGTLKLSIDATGLKFVLDIPDTTVGHDVYTNIKAGNLQGMSFGFSVTKDGEKLHRKAGHVIRTVTQIDRLNEISIVSVPAYEDTSINVTRSKIAKKSADQAYKSKVIEELEVADALLKLKGAKTEPEKRDASRLYKEKVSAYLDYYES